MSHSWSVRIVSRAASVASHQAATFLTRTNGMKRFWILVVCVEHELQTDAERDRGQARHVTIISFLCERRERGDEVAEQLLDFVEVRGYVEQPLKCLLV
jgi:hypothetical protein